MHTRRAGQELTAKQVTCVLRDVYNSIKPHSTSHTSKEHSSITWSIINKNEVLAPTFCNRVAVEGDSVSFALFLSLDPTELGQ